MVAAMDNESGMHIPAGMSRFQFLAMGTTITLIVPEQHLARGVIIVQSLFTEWEQTLSRFRPESELSQLNSNSGRTVIVGPLLFHVLTTALAAAHATHGIYDPTMLIQLTQLGYDRSFDQLSREQQEQHDYNGQPGGAWRAIQLEPAQHKVTVPPGVQLDFGGIAKGMAVDAALERLQEAGITPALVNAGGDLSVNGQPAQTDSWSIAIPTREDSWSLPLHHGAIATSGIERRHWQQGNEQRHHILDPRTGFPVHNALWSVTSIAPNCTQAEIAAKVAFILGPEQGKAFLQQHQLAGLFVSTNGHWETGGNWPNKLIQKIEQL